MAAFETLLVWSETECTNKNLYRMTKVILDTTDEEGGCS